MNDKIQVIQKWLFYYFLNVQFSHTECSAYYWIEIMDSCIVLFVCLLPFHTHCYHLLFLKRHSQINVSCVLYLSLNSTSKCIKWAVSWDKVPWRQYYVWCPLHINVVLGSYITSLGTTYTMEDVLFMLLEHQSVRIYDQREGLFCCTLDWKL